MSFDMNALENVLLAQREVLESQLSGLLRSGGVKEAKITLLFNKMRLDSQDPQGLDEIVQKVKVKHLTPEKAEMMERLIALISGYPAPAPAPKPAPAPAAPPQAPANGSDDEDGVDAEMLLVASMAAKAEEVEVPVREEIEVKIAEITWTENQVELIRDNPAALENAIKQLLRKAGAEEEMILENFQILKGQFRDQPAELQKIETSVGKVKGKLSKNEISFIDRFFYFLLRARKDEARQLEEQALQQRYGQAARQVLYN